MATLKELMDQRGKSEADLAAAVGVPEDTVNEWFAGTQKIGEYADNVKAALKSWPVIAASNGASHANEELRRAPIAPRARSAADLARELGEMLKQYREETAPTSAEISPRFEKLKTKEYLLVGELSARLKAEGANIPANRVMEIEKGTSYLKPEEFDTYRSVLDLDDAKTAALDDVYARLEAQREEEHRQAKLKQASQPPKPSRHHR